MDRALVSAGIAVLLGSLGATAAAQDDTFLTALGRWHVDGNQYSDCWGFETDDGREFAILCETQGLYFIETTDPYEPRAVAFVAAPLASQRDVKYYNGYVYAVTEGGGGLQIIDVRDPDAIVDVKSWTDAFRTAHNIFLDTTAGYALPCGTDNGMPILDLTNPTDPVHVATYNGAYVHDGSAGHGLAHLALVNAGQYCILDLTQLPNLVTRGCVHTPDHHTHTLWHDESRKLAITCDEENNGHVTVYDYSDPDNLVYLSEFDIPGTTTVHNAYLHEGIIHGAWTSDGYVVGDLSDPTVPEIIGIYDVDGNTWSCYPFTQSGNVYLSSVGNGLWVFRVEPARFAVAPIDDVQSVHAQLRTAVRAQLRPGLEHRSAVSLHLRSERQGMRVVPMDRGDVETEFTAEVDGFAAPDVVHYHFEGNAANAVREDSLREPRREHGERVFAVGAKTVLLSEDFEGSDDAGWTHGATFGADDWQRGAPVGVAKDPDHAASGSSCWGTELSGAAAASSERWLRSSTIPTAGHEMLRLRFRRWLSAELPRDHARILVNGNPVWNNPPMSRTRDTNWRWVDLDVTAAVAGAGTIEVEFVLTTQTASILGGWNIDDVEVYGLDAPAAPFAAEQILAVHRPGALPGLDDSVLSVEREDLVAFDSATREFTRWFDGSDVGLAEAPIEAVHVESDGSVLLSFARHTQVPGLIGGPRGDHVARVDLVRFVPTQLGEDTAGHFEFYFDGSDLGLQGNRVDAVSRRGGALLFSLRQTVDVGGLAGVVDDADVLAFSGSTGANTDGIIQKLYDGDDLGLDAPGEGIDALHRLDDDRILVSTRGDWQMADTEGEEHDLVILDPQTGEVQSVVDGWEQFLDEVGLRGAHWIE